MHEKRRSKYSIDKEINTAYIQRIRKIDFEETIVNILDELDENKLICITYTARSECYLYLDTVNYYFDVFYTEKLDWKTSKLKSMLEFIEFLYDRKFKMVENLDILYYKKGGLSNGKIQTI